MSRFWSAIVHSLTPYVPGEQPSDRAFIKLNTNENPYGPSPKVLAAIAAATDASLRLYPDPEASDLKAAIAAAHGMKPGNVFVGNGSDEVLAHGFRALLKQRDPLLFPDITYSFYPSYCRLYGIEFRRLPLSDSMRVELAEYQRQPGPVILSNPNAPTGIALTAAEIDRLLRASPDRVVVIDEAYVDFGAESSVALVRDHPNLLVIHTLSKSRGLAGLRVGYAIGQEDLIKGLDRVKNSFNSYPLDRLALAGAIAAIEDREWFEQHRRKIIATRDDLSGSLQQLGFSVLPSAANFLFARHPVMPGAEIAMRLRAAGILVRHFPVGRIRDYVRISIGTDAECRQLVEALGRLLRS